MGNRPLAALLLLMALLAAGVAHSSADLAPELQESMARLRPNDTVSVVLTFAEHANLDRMPHGRSAAPEIITTLQAIADRSQARVLEYLHEHGLGMKAPSFWINNSMVLKAPPEIIKALAASSEIERIDSDVAGGIPDGERWTSGVSASQYGHDSGPGDLEYFRARWHRDRDRLAGQRMRGRPSGAGEG